MVPLGKCFSVPAMSACTCVKAVALVCFDMVVDMTLFSFPRAVPHGVLRAGFDFNSLPSEIQSGLDLKFRGSGRKIVLGDVVFS